MTRFGLIEDYDYNLTHKRKRFTIWSGPFASVREGEMYSLPKGDGFMITLEYGDKVRVECPVERTDATYVEQDKAINDALNAHFAAKYAPSVETVGVSDAIDELVAESKSIRHGKPYSPNGKRILR